MYLLGFLIVDQLFLDSKNTLVFEKLFNTSSMLFIYLFSTSIHFALDRYIILLLDSNLP